MALLSVGSKAKPREDVLQIGDAGKKQLVEVKEEGSNGGIAVYLAKETGVGKNVLAEGGLPPRPPTMIGSKPYRMLQEQSYEGEYVANAETTFFDTVALTCDRSYPCRSWS